MTKCGFNKAWIGPCQNEQPCKDHKDLKCCSCGAPATQSCEETGQFVCGAPLCDECEHTLHEDGTNGGVGFNQCEPLEGMKTHCRKTEQRFKPWYVQEMEKEATGGTT
jgi:hypothetical protein